MAKKANPIKNGEEVQQNADPHIDQDFPGFPHLPADKNNITPQTEAEKKLSGASKKRPKKTYGG